jgi:hypothetical protein
MRGWNQTEPERHGVWVVRREERGQNIGWPKKAFSMVAPDDM